ncbi:MAG TPA: LysR family transcriptional regulator, partial [Burkholderiales bacterium]|nr:LysR family transcriptional regulator [Burkholderiales bacterium]
MNITLRQLRVFEAVVKHMSYTRASEELHLTQPAVSMQIRQLEDTVGMPLFEQLGKRIYLTEAGNEMLRYGKRILHEVNEADTVFNEMRGLHRGHLDIAVVTTANAFSSKVLAAFLKKYENISANLMVENRVKVLEHLQKNAIDLAVMGKPPASMDLTFQSFMENPLV